MGSKLQEKIPEQVYIYTSKVLFVKVADSNSEPYTVTNVKMIRRLYSDSNETYSFCFKTGDKYSGEYYYDVRIDSLNKSYFTRTYTSKDGTTKKSTGKIELKCLDIVPKPKGVLGFVIDGIWTEDSFDWKLHVDATQIKKLSKEEISETFE
jgi:hypothetical protein